MYFDNFIIQTTDNVQNKEYCVYKLLYYYVANVIIVTEREVSKIMTRIKVRAEIHHEHIYNGTSIYNISGPVSKAQVGDKAMNPQKTEWRAANIPRNNRVGVEKGRRFTECERKQVFN